MLSFTSGDGWRVFGRGYVYLVHLDRDYTSEEMDALVGREIMINQLKMICRSVDRFAIGSPDIALKEGSMVGIVADRLR